MIFKLNNYEYSIILYKNRCKHDSVFFVNFRKFTLTTEEASVELRTYCFARSISRKFIKR